MAHASPLMFAVCCAPPLPAAARLNMVCWYSRLAEEKRVHQNNDHRQFDRTDAMPGPSIYHISKIQACKGLWSISQC